MQKLTKIVAAVQAMLLISFTSMAQQVPSDNPVATHYYGANAQSYGWTDQIRWDNVINMKTYSKGTTNFEKFENARDEVYSQGGGVLYYPAGEYDFSDMPATGVNGRGLMLKSGVVIRGEKPTGDVIATDGTLTLPTKFVFGFDTKKDVDGNDAYVPRDWNFIGLMPTGTEQLKEVNNVGVVWVNTVGATIYWGPQIKWGATWTSAASWYSSLAKPAWANRKPNGDHPMDPFVGGQGTKADGQGATYEGAGQGRLVFGCKLEDAAVINNAIDFGAGDNGYAPYKFGPRIGAYGRNVLIANNLLPKSNKNFKYTQLTCETDQKSQCRKLCLSRRESLILFDYGKTCGIDVNKELLGLVGFNDPSYFEEGVVVQDNYVYNHGHKGYNISGKWVTVKNNYNQRNFLLGARKDKGGNVIPSDDVYGLGGDPWILTLDGHFEATPGGDGCISDNLARAFDLGGEALWVDKNEFTSCGSQPGNDGEGILCQLHGGTNLYSWAITNNTYTPNDGDGNNKGLIGGWDVTADGALIAYNKTPYSVGHWSGKVVSDGAFVENQATGVNLGSEKAKYDLITECPSDNPAKPQNETAVVSADKSYVELKWEDNTDFEIGYRIDRKIGDGEWVTIAMRPRQNLGVSRNAPMWRDFTPPKNVQLNYRIAAMNCMNGDIAATAEMPVLITSKETQALTKYKLYPVSPNPAKQETKVQFSVEQTQDVSVALHNVYGSTIQSLYNSKVEAGSIKTLGITTSQLPAGIYTVRIVGQGFQASQKFVVVH